MDKPSGIAERPHLAFDHYDIMQDAIRVYAQAEESIEEQIIHREQREKLLRQIESLEKQCRTEKQTRKKYELHQQIIKLKEELK